MNTYIQKAFLQEPSPRSAAFRYGLLGAIFALFALVLCHPTQRHLSALIVPTMLLFNHLAFQFRWPRGFMIALRVIALAWVVAGCIYVFTK